MLKYQKKNGNLIHKSALINWKNVEIGKNNIIGPYVVIGNIAQHPRLKSNGKIIIGNNNTFNEYTNIHLPTKIRKKTIIGNNNYFMDSVTIDHDCIIEDDVILSSKVVLGGNVYIMKGSQLGIKASIHQNQIIGSYCMIGMHSFVTKKLNLLPGYIYYGKPAKKKNKNLVGLKRNNITSKILKSEKSRYKKIKLRTK
ncbi:hypothetical protein [Candidatus Pelagibacter sp. HIMB1746]|uniref:hypothetical protein n=1 Tax=Candidatus Pelagibacter sp. HIMB1746 TaxID=3413370 RepID=UPI003F86C514